MFTLLPISSQVSVNLSMSINSSSFPHISIPHHLTSFNSSIPPIVTPCFTSKESIFAFVAVSITYLLLFLPLFILVLYFGYQQFRQQHSTSTSTAQSDAFLYNSFAMDLITCVGYNLLFFGSYFNLPDMMLVGSCFETVASCGQDFFHLLSCVERYLAVVKPITYRRLRHARGVKIRYISIGCVWFLSFLYLTQTFLGNEKLNMILYFCFMGFFLIATCFCSISVLCVLKHPGPGELGGKREQANQSKQRAFYTIMAIMGALLFRFGGHLITYIIQTAIVIGATEACVIMFSESLFNLPSTLVLPLLFLHRVGNLQ